MRWAKTLATAALAELAAHLLSLTWGFMVLLAMFVYVAAHLTASMAVASAKSADTEKRLNTLVPAVGAIKDTADSAATTAGNAMPKSGGHFTGDVTCETNFAVWGSLYGGSGTLTIPDVLHVDGATTIYDNLNVTGTDYFNGTPVYLPQADLTLATAPPSGTGGTSQYCGNFYTGSGAQIWSSTITNAVNAIIGTMRNANLIV